MILEVQPSAVANHRIVISDQGDHEVVAVAAGSPGHRTRMVGRG